MNKLSASAESARESARDDKGRFGSWSSGESEVSLTPETTPEETADGRDLGMVKHPAARKVLTVDAADEDWHAQRNRGIGSSEAAMVVGESPYGGPRTVYDRKTGQAAPFRGNNFTELGQVLEPYVRSRFERETGLATKRCGLLASKERDHMRANVDSFTEDGGVLEIKTFGNFSAVAEDWTSNQIPSSAWWQLQHGMAVSGRQHGYGIGMNRDTGDTFIVATERDDEAVERLTRAVDDTWEATQTGVPPEPVATDMETVEHQNIKAPSGSVRKVSGAEETKARTALSDWNAHSAEEKAVKDRKADAEARLRESLGDAETLTDQDGKVLVENRATKRLTQSGLKKYDPDLAKEYVVTVQKEAREVDGDRLAVENPEAYRAALQRTFKPTKDA